MTKDVQRYECKCEKCGKVWVTREYKIPANCPGCVARVQVWNKSEHLVDVRVDEGDE